MRTACQREDRGIAIIIVMVSMFALAILAGAFAYTMKVETKLAMNSNYETQLQWAGRSGIDYCRWVLSEEMLQPGTGQRYDSLDQAWAGGSGETNEVLLSVKHEDIELGAGVMIKKWSMVDTERKVNVNMSVNNPQMLHKALMLAGADVTEIPTIISSVQDWIDPDDDQRDNGAESDHYRSLDPPYRAKNGPLEELSELLLIKGMTPAVYWGTQASNHPSPIFQRQIATRSGMQSEEAAGTVALKDLLTTTSAGAINLLTASVTQLQVIPQVDETIAGQIVQLRSERDGAGNLAYGSPSDLLVNTALGREFAPNVAPYCTFRSPTREITVVVQVGLSVRTYFATVRINTPKDIPILGMRWEDGDHSAPSSREDSEGIAASQ